MARAPRSVDICAELVGNVMTVYVEAGDVVTAGDTVVLLESMKMEIPVLSEQSGTVLAVNVAAGDVVQEGDPLVTIDLSSSAATDS
jgi:biotin carboxyl carrier protein